MKTLGRILIILIAALAVSGAAYAISQTAAAQTVTGNALEMGQTEDRPAPADLANAQTAMRPEGGGEGVGGLQTLLKIALIVAAVQVLWLIGRWTKSATGSLLHKNRLNPGHGS